MPKVLISDNLSQNAEDIFAAHGVEVDVITGLSPEELQAKISAYDGLAIRSSTKVTEAVLAAATNLKVVGRAGIGVDNVDIVFRADFTGYVDNVLIVEATHYMTDSVSFTNISQEFITQAFTF